MGCHPDRQTVCMQLHLDLPIFMSWFPETNLVGCVFVNLHTGRKFGVPTGCNPCLNYLLKDVRATGTGAHLDHSTSKDHQRQGVSGDALPLPGRCAPLPPASTGGRPPRRWRLAGVPSRWPRPHSAAAALHTSGSLVAAAAACTPLSTQWSSPSAERRRSKIRGGGTCHARCGCDDDSEWAAGEGPHPQGRRGSVAACCGGASHRVMMSSLCSIMDCEEHEFSVQQRETVTHNATRDHGSIG